MASVFDNPCGNYDVQDLCRYLWVGGGDGLLIRCPYPTNYQVRLLGEKKVVTPFSYPTLVVESMKNRGQTVGNGLSLISKETI
jgi:hypothetical protein